jgi:hypothetical protein
MTALGHRVWYVPRASTSEIQLHPTLRLDLRDGELWFENLVEDIRVNGLDNPVLVHNQTMPCDELTPCRVVHGCNRFRAVKRLGWKFVPALIVGVLPRSMAKQATELHSIEEAQSYITDGVFTNHKSGCKILDANHAETCVYVRSGAPYKEEP